MADQLVIANKEYIELREDKVYISWEDKGKNWNDAWVPDTIHYVIWNELPGQNEIQYKDETTGKMTGNTDLNSSSDAVGTTTIDDLISWAKTRATQIFDAKQLHDTDVLNDEANGTTNAQGKDWPDYDPHYS